MQLHNEGSSPRPWLRPAVVITAAALWCGVLFFVRPDAGPEAEPETVEVRLTAYCLEGLTATGERVRPGLAAADPDVLPLGTIVRLDTLEGELARYNGVYRIADTGSKVRGRHVDLYIPDCREAREFGRQRAEVAVIEWGDWSGWALGWSQR